ncbi:unnamed protein product [Sympodiomycopsis kandeliae]
MSFTRSVTCPSASAVLDFIIPLLCVNLSTLSKARTRGCLDARSSDLLLYLLVRVLPTSAGAPLSALDYSEYSHCITQMPPKYNLKEKINTSVQK